MNEVNEMTIEGLFDKHVRLDCCGCEIGYSFCDRSPDSICEIKEAFTKDLKALIGNEMRANLIERKEIELLLRATRKAFMESDNWDVIEEVMATELSKVLLKRINDYREVK